MPNYVINRVTCPQMNKLKKMLLKYNEETEEYEVDFNKVIPMSNDLDITAGSNGYSEHPLKSNQTEIKSIIDSEFGLVYNKRISQANFVKKVLSNKTLVNLICEYMNFDTMNNKVDIEHYIKGYFNLKRYKAVSWYEWCIDNWGTKWNACNYEDYGNYIEFSTAWETCDKIFLELSKKVKLIVAFADEDICGNNCGVYQFENGVMTRLDDESFDKGLSCLIWGYDSCDIYDESDEEDYNRLDNEINEASKFLDKFFWEGI